MKTWIQKVMAGRREKQRQRLLLLIGRDIDRIAHDAYQEGCYITERRMRAEKMAEFAHLTAHNEKLTELMLKRSALDWPVATVLQQQESKP